MSEAQPSEANAPARRLRKADRRRQLLDVALRIVRQDGADRLTLGHLAQQAGVSKPVVYEHFADRSAALVALYRWIDTERVDAFTRAMADADHGLEQTIDLLAATYLRCGADLTHEFHVVGAALAGSDEKAAVYQELLGQSVDMFVAVLRPFDLQPDEILRQRCIGLVGAGEALSAAIVRAELSEDQSIRTFAALIAGGLRD